MNENNIPHIVNGGASIMPHDRMKPLTDNEIAVLSDKILFYQIYDAKNSGVYEFARAIEKAHGIE
jgi:hypothetical protein